MILKTTSYKNCDLVAHDTHAQGLTNTLEFITRRGNGLTLDAKRAMFWLDLYGAELANSPRQMSYSDVLEKVTWQRETRPERAPSLPLRFIQHREALPYGLFECISNLIELQAYLHQGAIAGLPHYVEYHHLDNMQASIECRLGLQAQPYKQLGVVAEAIRLGVFMCCYCTWMETWNDSLTLCRIAEKLLALLEPTVLLSPQQFGRIWLQHIDILLWLLLVGSSVVELDQVHMEGLRSRQSRLVNSVYSAQDVLRNCYQVNLKYALQNALRDSIYTERRLLQRCYVEEWSKLELSISTGSN
jgi:hypothetical protein